MLEDQPVVPLIVRACLVAGTAGAQLLILVLLVEYPVYPAGTAEYVAGVASSLLTLAVLGWWSGARAPHATEPGEPRTTSLSIACGAGLGLVWTPEINYNTVLAQPVAIRHPVDNVLWAVIALGILALAPTAAFSERRAAESTARGPTSGFPSMAVYFACQTLAAVMPHLVVLGIIMGALLVAVGGVGRALRARDPATPPDTRRTT